MSDYRTRNQLLLAAIETTAGTEATPTPGANAIRVRQDARFSPNLEQLDTDYVQNSMTQSAPIAGGGDAGMSLSAFLNCPATPGTNAPDLGPLLRACGLSQTQLAADVSGVTPSAGTTTTVPLAVAASGTTDAYRFMVIEMTSGTAANIGQRRAIVSYNGGTRTATLNAALPATVASGDGYAVRACTLYRPVDAAFEAVTAWHYVHHQNGTQSKRRRIKGAMSGLRLAINPRALANVEFALSGQLVAAPDDVSTPTGVAYQSGDPQPFINAMAYLGAAPVKFSSFSFDLGTEIEKFDNPAEAFGYDPAAPTNRRASGRIVPNLVLNSSRDAFADWLAATDRSIWLDWGVAGRRVSLFLPQNRNINVQDEAVRGYVGQAIDFRSTPAAAEFGLCFHV